MEGKANVLGGKIGKKKVKLRNLEEEILRLRVEAADSRVLDGSHSF